MPRARRKAAGVVSQSEFASKEVAMITQRACNLVRRRHQGLSCKQAIDLVVRLINHPATFLCLGSLTPGRRAAGGLPTRGSIPFPLRMIASAKQVAEKNSAVE